MVNMLKVNGGAIAHGIHLDLNVVYQGPFIVRIFLIYPCLS